MDEARRELWQADRLARLRDEGWQLVEHGGLFKWFYPPKVRDRLGLTKFTFLHVSGTKISEAVCAAEAASEVLQMTLTANALESAK